MKKFTDFTEDEKHAFFEAFYDCWDLDYPSDEDIEADCLWGAPWDWSNAEACNPKEWYQKNRATILEDLKVGLEEGDQC